MRPSMPHSAPATPTASCSSCSTSAPRCWMATPSYALYLGEMLARSAESTRSRLQAPSRAFRGGGVQRSMRAQIEERGCRSRRPTTTGSPRSSGPGVSGECQSARRPAHRRGSLHRRVPRSGDRQARVRGRDRRAGLHFADQRMLAGAALPHARPLEAHYETCECGRTLARMGKVVGRTDDMFIVSGVNVFPSTIESFSSR